MLDIPSISAIVATVGVLVGVAFAYLEVRTLVRQRETDVETRQAQLFMQIYDHYYDEEFLRNHTDIFFNWKWKDYDDFMKKYGPNTNPEAFAKWDSLGTYFRGIGVLVRRKLIDLNLVEELMGTSIRLHWEKSGPIIKELRERLNLPQFGDWVEYLYNEIQRREQRLQQTQQ